MAIAGILGKTTILYSPALRRVNSIPDFHSEFRILRIPEAGGEEFSGGRTASLPHLTLDQEVLDDRGGIWRAIQIRQSNSCEQ